MRCGSTSAKHFKRCRRHGGSIRLEPSDTSHRAGKRDGKVVFRSGGHRVLAWHSVPAFAGSRNPASAQVSGSGRGTKRQTDQINHAGAGSDAAQYPGEGGTRRAEEDSYAKFKYDATAEQDNVIISRVAELAEKHGVSMTEVSLAWLLTKVTSPVVGATKFHHIEGAAKAVELELSGEELAYLEEPYVPHPLAGVMAQNKSAAAKEKHVWSTGDQKIGR